MRKLCRVDIGRSEEIFEKINEYVGEVVRRLAPRCVILFGSFARRDISEGSDVDLVVVADFSESFLERIGTLLKLNEFGLPLEPVGYTPEEFRKMREEGNPFIEEVLNTGKILYGDPRMTALHRSPPTMELRIVEGR